MTALNDGYLDMPVLFLNARYDYVRECGLFDALPRGPTRSVSAAAP